MLSTQPDYILQIINLIISADPIRLSEGIKKSNSHYSGNEGYNFLEKIVDIPFYIDDLNKETKYIFWNKYKNQLISDFEGFKYIQNFLELLPDNIRGLKRYLRFLYNYINELKRYGEEEINIETFFIISLFKLEYPNECLSFIKKDVPDIDGKVIPFDNTSINNFKNGLDNHIKKTFFDFFGKRFFSSDELISYYYFYDNIDLLTRKEFLDFFLKGNKSFEDLENIFKKDYILLLNFLVNNNEKYYGKMINDNYVLDMQVNESYVNKIYEFILSTIDLIDDNIVIDDKKFDEIIFTLLNFSNFTGNGSNIDFQSHRNKEKKIISKIINKFHPEIVFKFRMKFRDLGLLDNIEDKYWNFILNILDKDIYSFELIEINKRKFIAERVINKNGLDNLNTIETNDIFNNNLFYLLYGFLEDFSENNINNPSYVSLIEKDEFKDLFSKINFSQLNHRLLGSFKVDTLDKLSQYNSFLSFIKDEVEKYIINS